MSEYSSDNYGSDFEDESPRKSSVVKSSARSRSSFGSSRISQIESPHRRASSVDSPKKHSARGAMASGVSSTSPAVYTPQEQATLKELQKNNATLRRELAVVNTQLDEELSRKGHKLGHRPPAASTGPTQHVTVLDQRRMQNDKLRKRNQKVEQRLEGKDLVRMRELQNLQGDATRGVKEMKDENRSLENVYANQRTKLAAIEKVEAEMSQAKAEASEEIREVKDQTRRLNRIRDGEAAEMNKLRRQLERLEQKIKIQDQVGQTVKSVAELQEQVEDKDRTLESLKYQVAVLSKTNITDKKRAKARSSKIQQQINDLREEKETLLEKVQARGIAEDLGVY